MKLLNRKDRRTDFEKEKERVLQHISKMDPDSANYVKAVNNLKILEEIESGKKTNVLSKDAVFTATASVASVGLILFWEQFHNVASKAFSFVIRGRVK